MDFFRDRVDSKGIIFFEEKYEHESQMDYQIILDRMNEELKKYILGPGIVPGWLWI